MEWLSTHKYAYTQPPSLEWLYLSEIREEGKIHSWLDYNTITQFPMKVCAVYDHLHRPFNNKCPQYIIIYKAAQVLHAWSFVRSLAVSQDFRFSCPKRSLTKILSPTVVLPELSHCVCCSNQNVSCYIAPVTKCWKSCSQAGSLPLCPAIDYIISKLTASFTQLTEGKQENSVQEGEELGVQELTTWEILRKSCNANNILL